LLSIPVSRCEEMESSEKLANTMRGLFLRLGGKGANPPPEISPGCPFGALVEQRLKDMERNIQEVKGRINGLIFLILGLILTEVITRLVG